MKSKSTPARDYTTGRTASELHVSPSHVRALCQAGIIAARATHGGHWRIPKGEVERLLRDGVPDPPPATPTGPAVEHVIESVPNPVRHPTLLAEPSNEAISAADDVVRLENEVRGIQLKRAKEESLDWFRDRQRQQTQAQAAHDRQRLEARSLQIRRNWENAWVEYALENIPEGAPESIRLPVSESVRQTLESLSPDDPEEVTEPLVRAAIDKGLQPWLRNKEIELVIQEARDQLPYLARGFSEPSEWELRAIRTASEDISRLRSDATIGEIRAASITAGRRIASEYLHQGEVRRIVESVFLSQPLADQERARHSVKEAIDRLPIGSTRSQMEQTREGVLAPYKAAEEAASVQAQASRQADFYLLHVNSCLEKIALSRNLGDFSRRQQLAKELKEEIRPILVEEILEEPLSLDEAQTFIASLVNRRLAHW
ncbi:MAG: helix-turn-helix domain-containing protein [Acidobacteriia bacterium]|nr:helix-turn-helix domain-containing protein [Terriglobia bacterium]